MHPEFEFKIEVESPFAAISREAMLNLKVTAAQAKLDKALAARSEAREAYFKAGRAFSVAERERREASRERHAFLRQQAEAKARAEAATRLAEERAKAQQQEADRNGLFLLTNQDGYKWLLHGIRERGDDYVKSCAYTSIGRHNPPKSARSKPTYYGGGGVHYTDGATLKLVG